MILSCASTVTRRTLAEFLLCKLSIEQYHQVEWFISCDAYTYNALLGKDNINLIQSIHIDDKLCEQTPKGKNPIFYEITSHKIDGVIEGIRKNGYGLFLDCDLLFTNPFDDKFINLLQNKNIDAVVSPHMTNWPSIEGKVGYYNTGFFGISNINLAYDYKNLCSKSQEYNLYYDQQPLQFACYNYLIASVPINYNIGWWRFISKSFNKETAHSIMMNDNDYESICLQDDNIFYKGKPAIFFHAHMLEKYNTDNQGHFLINKIFNLMHSSNNIQYHNIVKSINKHFCL